MGAQTKTWTSHAPFHWFNKASLILIAAATTAIIWHPVSIT